jgi:prevent-host-death family protein
MRPMGEVTLSISEFKAKCLRLIEDVAQKHTELVISKRGRRLAKVVPFDAEQPSILGFMEGTATIHGDIVAPLGERWEAADD